MAKYLVTLACTVIQSATLEIDADDEQEAMDKANALVRSDDPPSLDWRDEEQTDETDAIDARLIER